MAKGQLFMPGPRYVFFETLEKSGKKNSYYEAIYERGMGYVHQFESIFPNKVLTDKIIESNNQIDILKKYINFIKDIRDNERDNELNFIRHMKDFIENNRIEYPGNIYKNLKKFVDNIDSQQTETIDYLQLARLINDLLENRSRDFKKKDEMYIDLMGALSNMITDAKTEDTNWYEDLNKIVETKGVASGAFRGQLRGKIKERNIQFKEAYASLISRKLSVAINNIKKDFDFLESLANKMPNKSNQEQANIIVTTVLDFLFNKTLKELDSDQLVQSVKRKIGQMNLNDVSEDFSNAVYNSLSVKEMSIEALAIEGHGAGAAFFNLSSESEAKKFLLQYFSKNHKKLDKYGDELLERYKEVHRVKNKVQLTTGKLSRASYLINQKIRDAAKKWLIRNGQQIITTSQKSWADEWLSQLKTKWDTNSVSKYLQIEVKSNVIAELQAGKDVIDKKEFIRGVQVPGTKIKLKNDVSFVIYFNDKELQNSLQDNYNDAIKLIEEIPLQFIKQYHQDSKDITNVKLAMEDYKKTLLGAKKQIQQLKAEGKIDDVQEQELLKTLYNLIYSGVTVKDYFYGTNQFGFEGGSLGPNLSQIVDNISALYELGGLTKEDMDLIVFGMMNCGTDGIGKGLKDKLAQLLIGAAAIIMFDEGFAASTKFLDEMKASLEADVDDKLHSLHLYRVNGKTLPASLVYSTIYNNLVVLYGDIESNIIDDFNIPNVGAALDINNNITEKKDKPNWDDDVKKDDNDKIISGPFLMPEQRWNYVAKIAMENTKEDDKIIKKFDISFRFLTGLLDLLNDLPNAFKT